MKNTPKSHDTQSGTPSWTEVWSEIVDIIVRIGTPAEVRKAAVSAKTGCQIHGREMHVIIPDIVREYIEKNLDTFKPVFLPFLRSHNCTKLIYIPRV